MSLRVALIYDSLVRPETTGLYCRRALQTLAEVRHFLPTEMARIPRDFDLYLRVDDGLRYRLPKALRPSAWWAIDTHLDFERSRDLAGDFDAVFAAQKAGAEQLRQEGIESAQWLPLACDPEIHRPCGGPKVLDWCFVGNVFPGPRGDLLELLQNRFPKRYVGRQYFDEMARTYSAARVVFNRSIGHDVNMRVFEALACGSLLLTNDLEEDGQRELFEDWVHLATYRSADELLSRMEFFLKHDEQRERIAAAGLAEVRARHTYCHRMQTLLETVETRLSRTSIAIGGPSSLEVGSQAVSAEKSAGYFDHVRPEILSLVPLGAHRVLDVGCGAGRLGEAIKQRQACEVVGIELQAGPAESARSRLDEVQEINVEDAETQFPAGRFDCVIAADVLEHLRNPAEVLKKIRQWLAPEGTLVLSLPNARNHSVVGSLSEGNFTYEAAGLLDDDHVRFFTRREIEKLLYRAGFAITRIQSVPGPGYQDWLEAGCPSEIRFGRWSMTGMNAAEAAEFFAYQYLVVAQPLAATDRATQRREDPHVGLSRLRDQFPWPAQKPQVELPREHLGWFGPDLQEMVSKVIGPETRLIVELGAWLGLSTRSMADLAPQAQVITIDHWKGGLEHRRRPEWAVMLPTLYESFLALNWDYRQRVLPLRMTTREGLRTVEAFGLQPDVIFLDAEHSMEAVLADVEFCLHHFPQATLVGDDYDQLQVAVAVDAAAARHGLTVETSSGNWRAWMIRPTRHLRPAAPEAYGLTSIIVVTWNQWAYTKECLDSLRLRTDEPYELILVDNGSTDGTAEFLKTIPNAQVILNAENRGFPAAVNQGLQLARGDQVLLLNNDTVLTTGWLRRMLETLHSDPKVGLVGPCSNCISGPQQVPATYHDLALLDGFSWDWGKQYAWQVEETDRLVGFCLLIKGTLLKEVGVLDEQFGIGCFEDDDYCRRALQAGYRCLIARDSFVHHFGSRSFAGAQINLRQVLEVNQRKYEAKWQADKPTPASVAAQVVRASPPETGTSRVSLCMIVRDNETTIGPALESIRPWVDEIIIVDTGSKDRTIEICRQYGARIEHFAWIDDFSAARNESIKYATGDWIFWMDSDDTIPEECGRQLRQLVDGPHDSDVLGYVMQVHCPSHAADGSRDLTVVDHVKLFRNLPGLRFELRIHEQIIPAIRRAGGEVRRTGIYVVHSGSDQTPDGRRRKLERDYRILHRELEDHPEHPFVLFNLGMTYADDQRHEEAIKYLKQCLAVSRPEESHLRKAYALLIGSYFQLQQLDAAGQACRDGLALYGDDLELLFRSGLVHHSRGQHREAVMAYETVLKSEAPSYFSSLDPGLRGFKARQNLAAVYEEMGELKKAESCWRAITHEVPDYAPGWQGLGENLLKQSRLQEVQDIARQLRDSSPALQAVGGLLTAECLIRGGQVQSAIHELLHADRSHPQTLDAWRKYCQLAFEHADPRIAEAALEELTRRSPTEASAFHNLGTVRLRRSEYLRAVECFEQSLKLRPRAPQSWLFLGYAYRGAQQAERARESFEAALKIEPHLDEAIQALRSLQAS